MSKRKIHILYMGKHSDQIGPPKSMLELYYLLCERHKVSISKNLLPKAKHSRSEVSVTFGKDKVSLIVNKIKEFELVRWLLSLIYIVRFNIHAFAIANSEPGSVIVITQPFLILSFFRHTNIFYIRRASVPLNIRIGTDPVKRGFERKFQELPSTQVVYLADFKGREPGSWVIPNCVDVPSQGESQHKSQASPSIFVTGTFGFRKGADRVTELLDHLEPGLCVRIIGNIEKDYLHVKLHPIVMADGVLEKPWLTYQNGDIFLSLSRLEGFQRSMVEAMLRGCIVIATERPDSFSISDSRGVYLVPNDSGSRRTVEQAAEVISLITQMPVQQRERLGQENVSFAERTFCKSVIQKQWARVFGSADE